MTDNEIIKTLECCKAGRCISSKCAFYSESNDVGECMDELVNHSFDLINRQKAEIAELKSEISILTDANENLQGLYREEQIKVETAKQKVIDSYKKLKTAKAEAIREFAHFLIDKADISNNINISNLPDFVAEFISREAEK